MAISDSHTEVVSGDGASPWIRLARGPNKISVTSPSWDGTKAAALYTSDDGEAATERTAKLNGSAVSTAENEEWILDGPGFVRIQVSDEDGQPVTLLINPAFSR